jgi:uncharacterized protein YfaS (alpha-2-macroglobulin family)
VYLEPIVNAIIEVEFRVKKYFPPGFKFQLSDSEIASKPASVKIFLDSSIA